jgi:hypothetical protein
MDKREKRRQQKIERKKNCTKKSTHISLRYIHTFHYKHCRKMQFFLLFLAASLYYLTTEFYRGENCLDIVSCLLVSGAAHVFSPLVLQEAFSPFLSPPDLSQPRNTCEKKSSSCF